ncbi:hypothetical protein CY652_07505 [Burkholderia sp. WAC0059]|uniref:hypothetical protein n=1 Tax=Burkholderia sp. WAC0059 TaxID=2066022 RepID=UPI000C7E9315|nr:hypothetical protein [Burkholderia sp. WAC0059]PLZ03141.1 hypothetical protein CY652_07505 [Burkholderia sp. WAC0059]
MTATITKATGSIQNACNSLIDDTPHDKMVTSRAGTIATEEVKHKGKTLTIRMDMQGLIPRANGKRPAHNIQIQSGRNTHAGAMITDSDDEDEAKERLRDSLSSGRFITKY